MIHLPAIAQAKALFQSVGVKEPFELILSDYMRNGYVGVAPNFFAMCKTMRVKVNEATGQRDDPQTLDDLEPAPREEATLWFCCFAIGDLRMLASIIPFDLPYIAFCRDFKKELKIYPFDVFKRKVGI